MFTLPNIISILSSIIALASVIFAWQAVRTSQRNNSIALFSDLYNRYSSKSYLNDILIVYKIFKEYSPKLKPINEKQAKEFVKNTDRNSSKWKAVHNISSFWRYISLLLRLSFLQKEVAFTAFTSPEILGFLHPIEKAFLEQEKQTYAYKRSLKHTYDVWQKYNQRTL